MLLRNGRSIYQNPGQFSGSIKGESGNFIKSGGLRNRFVGGLAAIFSAYPSGHLSPSAFVLPKSDGAISSYTLGRASISGTSDLIPARNLSGSSSLSITSTNAQLDQIVSLACSGTLSLSTTSAQLAGAANVVASGTCTMTQGTVICGAIVSLTGSSSLTMSADATLTALAFMEAEGGGATPLSPEALANAVWDSAISDHTEAGTFGAITQKSLTVARFLGLK